MTVAPTRKLLQDYAPLLVLAAAILAVGLYDHTFFMVSNLITIAADTMTLFLMASGITFVIMIGGIDLSIQSVASMASCILALSLPHWGFAAIPFAILAGAVAGASGGIVSTQLRIPSFIATLAVSGVVTSVAYWVSSERSINIAPKDSARNLGWAVGEFAGLPNEIWIGLLFLVILGVLLGLTPFGRLVRAIGSQERAVIASGINVNRTKIVAYALSGTMAAISGVVMAARLGSGSPTLANEFLLPAIACIVVGGTAITGGVGSIWRTLVGALIVQVARIGMTFVGVSAFSQQIVFGAILVAAVAATMDRSKIAIVK